jgi:hypothetical protein
LCPLNHWDLADKPRKTKEIMSNKVTRKSLAFGALVALATTAIAGTPAQAAGEVVFAPTAGTSYNTFLDASFSLTASLAPGQVAANITQLKYQIVGTAAGDVLYKVNGTGSPVATTAASQVISGSGSATTQNTLALTTSSAVQTAGATYSATVTAFIDSNSNNVLDAGEYSQARTVTFKKDADVVPTVTITSAGLAGDTSVKATANYGDFNTEQLTAADFKVVFTSAGATAAGVVASSGVYTDTVTALVAGNTVAAQAKYLTRLLGTAVTQTVAAQTIATVTGAVVAGANAITGYVRPNSAFAVKGTVKNSTPAAVAGVSVTAAISTNATLATGVTLSVNGTVYNGTTALPTALALTSDANGEVLVNLIPSGYTAGQTVTVTFSSQNINATAVTVAQQAPLYTIADSQDDTSSANRAIAKGQSVSFNMTVKDQYGQAITGGARIKTVVSGGTTAAAAYTTVTAGAATVTVTDTQTAASPVADTATFYLETQDSATLNWNASNVSGFGVTNAASAPVTIAVSATYPGFASAPLPAGSATKFTGTVSPTAYADVTGVAGDNGVALLNNGAALATSVAGQKLTISGTGLLFRVNSKNYADTVTFFSGAAGAFAVTVYGHTAGDQTVTLVTGSTTKTAVITFAAGAPALASIVTPANAQVGQAMDVVINVTDKWGNAVATPTSGTNAGILSVSSTGVGYFASANPVANAAGKATVKYIVGTADIGTAYLSATLDLATDVTTAKSVEFGLTDADVVAGGHRVFVNYSFAKGRTLTITIDGVRKYSQIVTTDNDGELAFTQKKAGYHTVTVRISGGIVFTEKVKTN